MGFSVRGFTRIIHSIFGILSVRWFLSSFVRVCLVNKWSISVYYFFFLLPSLSFPCLFFAFRFLAQFVLSCDNIIHQSVNRLARSPFFLPLSCHGSPLICRLAYAERLQTILCYYFVSFGIFGVHQEETLFLQVRSLCVSLAGKAFTLFLTRIKTSVPKERCAGEAETLLVCLVPFVHGVCFAVCGTDHAATRVSENTTSSLNCNPIWSVKKQILVPGINPDQPCVVGGFVPELPRSFPHPGFAFVVHFATFGRGFLVILWSRTRDRHLDTVCRNAARKLFSVDQLLRNLEAFLPQHQHVLSIELKLPVHRVRKIRKRIVVCAWVLCPHDHSMHRPRVVQEMLGADVVKWNYYKSVARSLRWGGRYFFFFVCSDLFLCLSLSGLLDLRAASAALLAPAALQRVSATILSLLLQYRISISYSCMYRIHRLDREFVSLQVFRKDNALWTIITTTRAPSTKLRYFCNAHTIARSSFSVVK